MCPVLGEHGCKTTARLGESVWRYCRMRSGVPYSMSADEIPLNRWNCDKYLSCPVRTHEPEKGFEERTQRSRSGSSILRRITSQHAGCAFTATRDTLARRDNVRLSGVRELTEEMVAITPQSSSRTPTISRYSARVAPPRNPALNLRLVVTSRRFLFFDVFAITPRQSESAR